MKKKDEVVRLENLVQCQREYIALLEKVTRESAIFLHARGHSPNPADVKEGIVLREKIKLASI